MQWKLSASNLKNTRKKCGANNFLDFYNHTLFIKIIFIFLQSFLSKGLHFFDVLRKFADVAQLARAADL